MRLTLLLKYFFFIFTCLFASQATLFAAKLEYFSKEDIPQLQFGQKSSKVKSLQKVLNISGYSVSEDGPGSAGEETDYFGPQVKQALVSFQKENEIPTSGIVDTRTIALLNEFVKFLNNNDVDTAKEKSNSIDKYGSLEEGGYYDDVGIDSFFDKGSKDVTDYFSDAFGQYFDNQSILNNSLNLKGLDTKNLVPFKNIDIVGSRKTQKEFTIFDCFLDVRCANAPYEN